MREREHLAEILAGSGPWSYAYIDGAGDSPQVVEQAHERSVRDRFAEIGASEADVEALAEALTDRPSIPSPSARYLLMRDGEVVLDEDFAGARLGPERFGHGPVPGILPLLRHSDESVRFVVVETGREGAEVRLETAAKHSERAPIDVAGRDDSLPKVQAGGWSHARYQRHSEDVWMHNQNEVADVVDRLVREHCPKFVVVAGDVRARQLLADALDPASSALVVDVDTHTRADGADGTALEEAIRSSLDRFATEAIHDILDRAAADNGSRGAEGVDAVTHALQQAQVEALVLDARLVDSDSTLIALDAEPWVAAAGDATGEANALAEIPVAEALARAAVLTSASVLVEEDDPGAPDAPREERLVREPRALLRWPEDPPS
ncbi:MAG: Vms1/Ankzf1 family peptidyl-tRNA hydrolase [Microbacterium sp.]|uniref:baeRF2 domain-containing protein n=1 Tax=Microbacterium sp. TaxID=51671 RepID=UPI00271ACB2A|nr:Vms1/Ankzf1 family peptidyl-tRNA hydrolase [Microbacterium sp.]MDO8381694.1 Vms1/Ankzf1 family peptidyl-tRNA hydrolase [Microbacterium sp.]